MPRIKRWFPASQDLNDDGDLWDLTDKFGDRAIRVWLEILSILDKTENRFVFIESTCKGIFRKCRITHKNGWGIVGHCLASRWLGVPQEFLNRSPMVLGSPNYWKYHPKVESERFFYDSLLPSFLPNSSLKKEKNDKPTPQQPPKEPASPEPSASIQGLKTKSGIDQDVKVAADAVYSTNPEKFARLITWIKQAQKGHYSDEAIIKALKDFLPYATQVDAKWWPYLDKLIYKAATLLNGRASESEHEEMKKSEGAIPDDLKRALRGLH